MFFTKIRSSKLFFIATGKVNKIKVEKKQESFSKLKRIKSTLLNPKGFLLNIFFPYIFIPVGIVTLILTAATNDPKKKKAKEDPVKVMLEVAFRQEREKAFFWGQKNAIEGDIRIKKINDSTWIWIKSPWNDGTQPSVVTLHVDKGQRK